MTGESYYADKFKQGATIVPRNFFFIEIIGDKDLTGKNIVAVKTDAEQQKKAKKPWKDYILEGQIETVFLCKTSLSESVYPFLISSIPNIVLPVLRIDSKYELLSANEIREKGYRYASDWFFNAEKIWNKERPVSFKNKPLIDRLNYQKGLINQNPNANVIVLYNASGKNISGKFV